MITTANSKPWGLHWFRRDLRICGNAALQENWKKSQGRTLGIFFFDSQFLSRPDFSHNRFAFFLQTLKSLQTELRNSGGDLLVVDCLPHEGFAKLLDHLRNTADGAPQWVSWNRDYEPFAVARDARMQELLQSRKCEVLTCRDHLIFEPGEILKSEKAGDFYQVYSPFARKWFAQLQTPEGQKRIASQKPENYLERLRTRPDELTFSMHWKSFLAQTSFPFSDSLSAFADQNQKSVTIPIPDAGFNAAFAKLQVFKPKVDAYKDSRDFPAVPGTSQLSMYLKNGSLTAAQIVKVLGLGEQAFRGEGGGSQYIRELAWREFYYAILWHRPDVETQSFLPQYKNLQWSNRQDWFERWQEGTTGFPIVDAGMRELQTTGWMHNRVRMIVASFLTKDLLIDWRWGENHFMKWLLDGDLAPNNGGWQWAASTGCDPQPYFRIFNPWLQSERFDPSGDYIRKFIPELRMAPSAVLHDPEADRSKWKYPSPIVDHRQQKELALALYKSAAVKA